MKNIEELKELNQKLTSLLNDPQPGLITWHECVAEVLGEMAEITTHQIKSQFLRPRLQLVQKKL